MKTITFDEKLFDYSKVTEPLVAVPRSFLKKALKIKTNFAESKILSSYNESLEDIANNRAVDAFDFIKTLKK